MKEIEKRGIQKKERNTEAKEREIDEREGERTHESEIHRSK